VAWVNEQGVALSAGGAHVGVGTKNFLSGLGGETYLEVIGPDKEQPEPAAPRPFRIDKLTAARLVTWAARVTDLATAINAAAGEGYELSGPQPMSRRRPDGVLLAWELAFPPDGDGVVPFLIDWGDSPHPTETIPPGTRLTSLRAVHPEPGLISRRLRALGQPLDVTTGEAPGLTAVLATPSGAAVVLR
jgi:hypothetical protein